MSTEKVATQEGVTLEEEQENHEETPQSRREKMFSNIEEKLEKQDEQPEPEPQPDAADDLATDPQPVLVEDPKLALVRVKIGGEEQEKSVEAVVNELHTATGRLRQVSTREKELEAREQVVSDREKQIELAALPSSEEDDAAEEALIEKTFDALIDGDADTGKEALRELLKGRQPTTPQVDTKALVSEVKSEVQADLSHDKQVAAGKSVWDEFERDNPEFRAELDEAGEVVSVTKEREFGDFVFERDFADKVASGELDYREALNQTAVAVREVFSPSSEPDPSDSDKDQDGAQDRQARKDKIENLPIAAGARQVLPEAGADESPSETIQEMRKKRGLS